MSNSAANEISSVEIPSTAFSMPRDAEDDFCCFARKLLVKSSMQDCPGKACKNRDSPTKAGMKDSTVIKNLLKNDSV